MEEKAYMFKAARPPDEQPFTIQMIENEQEWKEARRGGIGGSDAQVPVLDEPWFEKTKTGLWDEKSGYITPKDISNNPAVIYGHAAEGLIRDLYVLDHPEYEMEYHPYWMYWSKESPFMFYTADGILTEKETGRKGIWECKTSTINRQEDWNKWDKQIPPPYYVQVLHGLYVTGYTFVELHARLRHFHEGELRYQERTYHIERSDEGVEEDIKLIAEKEAQFWKQVEDGVRPTLLLPAI